MKCKYSILLASLGFAAFLLGPSPALAASAPALGSAGSFAVLAGTAVTCTDSTVTGDVGVGFTTALTQTNCTINGTAHVDDAVAQQAYADLLAAYAALAATPCTQSSADVTLASQTLTPGVYCFDAALTMTDVVLTLKGPPKGIWIFKIGTLGTGALTGTNFSVIMAGGAQSCNVYWWTAEDATLTDSNFQGTILAGGDITVTRGTFNGDALAGGAGLESPRGAVTLTGATVASCEASGGHRAKFNQWVGNVPEGCDPGNSNQGDPSRSNDELGGTPGNPGRKGGNGK